MAVVPYRLLISVGSRRDQVCSIGAFARAEANAYQPYFQGIEVLEPDIHNRYPYSSHSIKPDFIFFHTPSLYDRKYPWQPLRSLYRLRKKFPKAKLISIVHEYSEAPIHWKLRQIALLKISHAAIVNTHSDFLAVQAFHKNILRSHLGPTLFLEHLNTANFDTLKNEIEKTRQELANQFQLDISKKWILHPGLFTGGKGIDTITSVLPNMLDSYLILMGSPGPKIKDRLFAQNVISNLKAQHFHFKLILSPDDSTFKKMLLASDLVLLPYDAGVSERRSSFLSAMSCGANVFTTRGQLSGPLGLEDSGAYLVSEEDWKKKKAMPLIHQALLESNNIEIKKRLLNLRWSQKFSWKNRMQSIQGFLEKL